MLVGSLLPHLGSREASRHNVNTLQFSLPKGGKMYIHPAGSIHVHCVSRLGLVSWYRLVYEMATTPFIDFLMMVDDYFFLWYVNWTGNEMGRGRGVLQQGPRSLTITTDVDHDLNIGIYK